MRIEKYVHTSREEVESKQHNIWIGISLGNKYFSKENIRKYIEWALQHTHEKVLIVIGDSLHAVNLEVMDERSPSAAMKKALRMGEKKFSEVRSIIERFPMERKDKIFLVRFQDAIHHPLYQQSLAIFQNEFKTNDAFHDFIVEIIKSGRRDRAERLQQLSNKEMDRLAEYVLHELPHFIDGVQAYGDNRVYTLLPYPGLSKLDELFLGLQDGTLFPELARKLHITHSIGIVEAYVK